MTTNRAPQTATKGDAPRASPDAQSARAADATRSQAGNFAVQGLVHSQFGSESPSNSASYGVDDFGDGAWQPAIAREPRSIPMSLSVADTALGGNLDNRSLARIVQRMPNGRRSRSAAIPARLAVSPPDDPREREADRIAERVMSSAPASMVQRKCAECQTGARCSKCSENEQPLQAKEKPGQTPRTGLTEGAELPTLRGGGHPLPENLRDFFQSHFRRDFDQVHIHTGAVPSASASTIGARAYTVSNDIAFAPGEYDPHSESGVKLIAHELTHVLQQSHGGDGSESTVQRQASGSKEKEQPLTVPFDVEYVAYDQSEDEHESSVVPAMFTAFPQALGYWPNPPGSAFREYFKLAWMRRLAFQEPMGQLSSSGGGAPGGQTDWLLERYAGKTSYDARTPQFSSRVKEFFGFGLRDELVPRSVLPSEQGGQFAKFMKLTPEEVARIPDILRRVNSGGTLTYTQAEADLLHRAASAHGNWGQTGGSPFLSTTSKPGLSTEFEATPKKFLSGRPYVVRVRVPNSIVLEMNKIPGRLPTLIAEQEMLVTADLRGRIVAVQPNPTSSLARGEPYMRWGGRAFLAFGIGMSGYRIATASEEDRPMVIMQEVATHAGGLGGAGAGAAGCVALGVVTSGIGLFACGLVGAFLGAEAANKVASLPFLWADALVNQLPYAFMQMGEGLERASTIARSVSDTIVFAPALRTHAMLDPGNWDLRRFSPDVAPDVAAVGIAMWERLGPLRINEFIDEVSKPVGSFGVPVASTQRIAAFLSGPDKQYNASMPALYASIGTSMPAAPAVPGINILELKPFELMELLANRKLNFVQDPNYLAGFASRLEAEPMTELRLRLLIEQRERIAEDNWTFPGKTHEQVRALRYVGQIVWNALKGMEESDFAKNVDRRLSTFRISDWALQDAARRINELSAFGTPLNELTENERAEVAGSIAEVAQQIGEMTPDDYASYLSSNAGLAYIKSPTAASYETINRVRQGGQPW